MIVKLLTSLLKLESACFDIILFLAITVIETFDRKRQGFTEAEAGNMSLQKANGTVHLATVPFAFGQSLLIYFL